MENEEAKQSAESGGSPLNDGLGWMPAETPPEHPCSVRLKRESGKEENGCYALVNRKDGPEMAFIAESGWLAMWDSDRITYWQEIVDA